MYSFKNDYSEGAHEKIMTAMLAANRQQSQGYGEDDHCQNAARYIRKKIGRTDVDVHFLLGGTQVNLTVLAAFLRPYEAAIAVETGHICVHETGAIEATGHKVISVPGVKGKLTPQGVEQVIAQHMDEHMVKPRLVYISNSTELGTLYTRDELQALRTACDRYGLYFYMDGARLASALTSKENDLTMEDLPRYLDAFYTGGTKCGALFGEALVICKPELKPDFRYMIKQRGAMAAKGWLLGIQFEELFRDDLYFALGEHANDMAALIRSALSEAGIRFFSPTASTNQIFPILSTACIEQLLAKYAFGVWEAYDQEHTIVRFVTSWATEEEAVHDLIREILKQEM